eukprot:TRINITY_DN9701_c0_g1_i6.p1 TRINITY_DN9701_c0_g1~~TRINITY_DN9701_c0_g1_i6.p1  ORF type:complete len:382 (+),score=51.65 TRINITY_DN9701_c0_g1_i6:41-1147(+)
MPSITGFFRVIRENPKKIVFFGGVAYLIADYARSRWHRMEHREAFCREARHYGQMSLHPEALPRRMFILLHPRAGPGENRGFFEKEVAPIFHLAGLDYDVRRIKHTEEVRDIVFSQDLSKYDDVVIVGGDGFFQEAMSGLLQRPDAQDVTSSKGLGLVPVGNSNNLFRTRLAQSQETDRALLAHEAALGIVEGRSKAIDAIQIEFADTVMPSFAFSSVGWGLFGGAAARGQNRRWPNQSRYDVGALSGLLWDYSKTSDCQAAVRVNDAQSSQRHHPALLATINAFWASGSRRVVDDEPAAGLTVVDLPETTGLGSLLARAMPLQVAQMKFKRIVSKLSLSLRCNLQRRMPRINHLHILCLFGSMAPTT